MGQPNADPKEDVEYLRVLDITRCPDTQACRSDAAVLCQKRVRACADAGVEEPAMERCSRQEVLPYRHGFSWQVLS